MTRAGIPLSFAQERLWVLDRITGGTPEYNLAVLLGLDGPLDLPALTRAIRLIVRRHEAWRSRFAEHRDEVVQIVEPDPAVPLEISDVSTGEAAAADGRCAELLRRESREPFDLRQAPLVRFRLVRLAEQRHILCRTAHHIVDDRWSMRLFVNELLTLYQAFRDGRDSPLADLPLQYGDYVLQQRGGGARLQADDRYWRGQLQGAPAHINLLTDRPRPLIPSLDGRIYQSFFDEAQTAALRNVAGNCGATLYMSLLALFGILLAHHAAQRDLLISTPISDRHSSAFERVIGFFINVLPMRIRLDWGNSFRDCLLQVRQTVGDACRHGHVSFEQMRRMLGPCRPMSPSSLTQVAMVMQEAAIAPPATIGELRVAMLPPVDITTSSELALNVLDERATLTLSWLYNTALFERQRVEQMAQQYARLATMVAANPDARLGLLRVV